MFVNIHALRVARSLCSERYLAKNISLKNIDKLVYICYFYISHFYNYCTDPRQLPFNEMPVDDGFLGSIKSTPRTKKNIIEKGENGCQSIAVM